VRIGVFDSGIGGLTVFAALAREASGHDLMYLGDTARVPYGTRSPRTVVRYARRVASYLHAQGAELIVIACNTATAHALQPLQEAGDRVGVPVLGVIEPGVATALGAHSHGGVAVLATEGTVSGGAYQRALTAARPEMTVHAVPCPLLVPLAEEGWVTGEVPALVVERYVGHLRGQIDTAILGCTHYPLLRDVFTTVLPGVTLVDSATATAHAVRAIIGPGAPTTGSRSYTVTDHVERFIRVGERFLGYAPDPVTAVDLPPARGAFADPNDLDV
jgi:glutamate racemase